jgi:hypothetical protein
MPIAHTGATATHRRASHPLAHVAALLTILWIAACTAAPPAPQTREIDALAHAITALGPDVSTTEATRAAEIAYRYPLELAAQYGITDPPLLHNTKVNMGLRPRGLCWHWAEDLEKRLAQENFQTLTLHRAIANFENPLRIEHSTVIVSAKGDDMFHGIVLDAWRKGGRLTWVPTLADDAYRWRPRGAVLSAKRARRTRRAAQ